MKKFNLLRKSERKSVGTTLALTVGSPSVDRRYSALKHLTFMLLFLLGSLNVWGGDQTVTWTVQNNADLGSGIGSGTITDNGGYSWSYERTLISGSSYTGNLNNGYLQIGKNGGVENLTFTTSDIPGTIKSVTVDCASYQGKHKVSITVGTTTYLASTAVPTWSSNSGGEKTGSKTGDQAVSGSISIAFTDGTRALYIKSITVVYNEGGAPDPVLESIEISGTPEKDTYEAGEEFDPTGLIATGHYDNSTSADITSSVEWAYTPAGALTQGLTSVNVTATKGTVVGNKNVDITVNAALPKSSLIFTAACSGTGTANDGVEWIVESDAAESTFDSNRGVHYGTSSKAVSYIELTSAAFSDKIKKIEVEAAGANTPSITVTVGGATFGETATGITNSNVKYTFEPTPAQSAIEFSGVIVVRLAKESSANGALYVKSVVVTYESDGKEAAGLAYDDSDLSNLVKLGNAFTAPTLTNPHSLTVAYESSNTDVAEVNASTGALNLKAVGIAEITASFAGDDDYKAGSAQYALYVVAHEGTEADPYTVADARVVIDKVGETGIADKYATGIVSKIVTAYNSTYGNITYDISDDGTTEAAQLRAYRGFDKDGEWFTSEDDVMVGDEVVVKGLLKKFNSTYEFDAENQLVSLNRSKAAAGLAYTETAVEKNIGDPAFTNTLTNPNSLDVTYSSTVTGVATVDENGEVTIVGMGTTTIKASFAGNPSYLADEVSYTLTVEDPSLIKVTFDATIDKGESPLSKSNISLSCSNGVLNNESEYRLYKNSTTTFECSAGTIAKIEFIGVSGNPASGFAAPSEGNFVTDGNNATWTGNAASVSFEASGAQVRATKIFVSYREDTRAEAGLEYAETAVAKTVGDDVFVNTLTNPNSVDVTYESSDTDVAEVASDGTVTIKAQGTTTITASFEGNPTYKPASVSYELTVNEPGLDNVTFDATIDVAGSGELSITKNGFTLTFTGGAMDNSSEYRLFKSETMTLSSNDYLIKKIEFTCTTDNPISGFADATGLDKANNQWTGEANKVELTASNKQVRIEQMIVYYVEDTRETSDLAWNTDEVEITLGETFTAASLVNPNGIDAAEITIESSNTNLATVENGVVSLEEDAIGTATITATFAGNATYKPAEFSYTIKVNDPTPMIITNPTTYLNFGSVAQNALVNAKNLEVTLQNVTAATVTITGEGAAAFSVDQDALTANATLHVSASSAHQGTFAATLTISDDADAAADKEISLSLTVTEPSDDLTGTWNLVTDASDLMAGMQVIVASVADGEGALYTLGGPNGASANNRIAVAGTASSSVLTPAAGTKVLTLVDAGEGKFALQLTNGNYLYAQGGNSNNYLKERSDINNQATWTITIEEGIATIKADVSGRNWMRKNTSSAIFSCYASGQDNIVLYAKPFDYSRNVSGNYATICLPKAGKIYGASLYEIAYYGETSKKIFFDEIVNGEMVAGRPYIFQPAAGVEKINVYYSDNTALDVEAGSYNGLIGFYDLNNPAATHNITQDAGYYILYNNQYWLVSGRAAYVENYRAYIELNQINPSEPTLAPGRRRISMSVNDTQTATGIESATANEAPRKVLLNGELFILRGEKMYDAKGQLVK